MTRELDRCHGCEAMLLCVSGAVNGPYYCEGCSRGELTVSVRAPAASRASWPLSLKSVMAPATCPKILCDAQYYFCQECWKDGTAEAFEPPVNERTLSRYGKRIERKVGAPEAEGWRSRDLLTELAKDSIPIKKGSW